MDLLEPSPIRLAARAFGPGAQPDDDAPSVLALPRGAATARPPALPSRACLRRHGQALALLHDVLEAIGHQLLGRAPPPIPLGALAQSERSLLEQVLGEGEVVARVAAQGAGEEDWRAQESVFAGVWQMGCQAGARLVTSSIEVGPIPAAIPEAARRSALRAPAPSAVRPAEAPAAVAVLDELHDRQRRWKAGAPAHVINLSLLPLGPADSRCLEEQVGQGAVTMLSRGYGPCRIASTRLPRVWRVTYFNAQGTPILDTLEVADVPAVAAAAREDLEDSAARLTEVLQWVEADR